MTETNARSELNRTPADPIVRTWVRSIVQLANGKAWASGLARLYWYEWDNTAHGQLWSPYSIGGCMAPFTSGYLCEAGVANQQVYDWIVGSTLTSCSASGTTWT